MHEIYIFGLFGLRDTYSHSKTIGYVDISMSFGSISVLDSPGTDHTVTLTPPLLRHLSQLIQDGILLVNCN